MKFVTTPLAAIGIAVLALLIAVSSNAKPDLSTLSAAPASENVADWPIALQKKSDLIHLVKHFPSTVPGITGWIVSERSSGAQSVVYTANNGTVVIVGGLIDKSGKNLTKAQFAKYGTQKATPKKSKAATKQTAAAPKASTPPTSLNLSQDHLDDALNGQPSVVVGNGKTHLSIVVDPKCPYCHRYFTTLMSHKALLSKYTFTFYPVGILGFDSVREAALFTGKTDQERLALLKEMMGGGTVSDQPTSKHLNASMARTHAWSNAGLSMVPVTIAHIGNPTNRIALAGIQSLDTLAALSETSLAPPTK